MRHVYSLGPSKFRIGAENGKEKTCHYKYNKKRRAFNRILVVRKQTSNSEIIDCMFFSCHVRVSERIHTL